MLIRISTKLFHSSGSTHAGSSTKRGLNSVGFSDLGFSETGSFLFIFITLRVVLIVILCVLKIFTSSGKNFTSVVKIFN